jgi:hypothetical protein
VDVGVRGGIIGAEVGGGVYGRQAAAGIVVVCMAAAEVFVISLVC